MTGSSVGDKMAVRDVSVVVCAEIVLSALKMGAHTGACLAVTLNGRLDYFGQAVNLAARVQALSDGNEIVITAQLLEAPRVRDVLDGYALSTESVDLEGIDGAVPIHRLRAPPAGSAHR